MQETIDKFMRKKRVERIAESTQDGYRYNLLTFKNFYNGRIQDLTQDDVDDYILYLQDETDLSLVTVNNRIRALRALLNFCFKQNLMPKKLDIKLIKINEPEINAFDGHQLKELYDACLSVDSRIYYSGREICHYRDYILMRMLEETGMRLGEALRLNLNDVDLKQNIIQLRQTKNGKSRQTYITNALNKEIKKYLEARKKFLYEKNRVSTEFFITNNGSRLNQRTIQKKIAKYGDLAGLTGVRCPPHTFRHTFAKNYLQNGGDVFTLKDILGHSSLDMTYRYARLFGVEQQNQYIKVMERYTKTRKVSRA